MLLKGTFINPACNDSEHISLHSCGCGHFEKNFCHGPNVRDEYIIHYIISGKGFFETSFGTFPFGDGDIFCIYPNDMIKYYTNETRTAMCFVNFVGTASEKILDTIGISKKAPVAHINNTAVIDTIQKCMYYLKETSSPSQLRLTSFITEILSHMERGDGTNTLSLKQSYINKGVAFMEYYFDTDISMESISHAAGVERSYFYRIFKEWSGVAPVVYLTNIRIRKAKELIEAGIDFKTVASAVGINDVYYFSKLFTKTEGMTPSAYRKKVNQNKESHF